MKERDRNKKYIRANEGVRNSNLIFIFCEGVKTERRYFYFFNQISSRIILQIMPHFEGRQSPKGLYDAAVKFLVEPGLSPEYSFLSGDEVWFVFDTDHYSQMIEEVRPLIKERPNWNIAQSNPSFEVWLYYHFFENKPTESIKNWKNYLNHIIPGGFDNRFHPKLINKAINNSKNNFSRNGETPDLNSTEVYLLGEKIISIVNNDISQFNSNNRS